MVPTGSLTVAAALIENKGTNKRSANWGRVVTVLNSKVVAILAVSKSKELCPYKRPKIDGGHFDGLVFRAHGMSTLVFY